MAVVKLLYEAKADLFARDSHFWRPYDSAVDNGHDEIAHFLIKEMNPLERQKAYYKTDRIKS